MLVVRPWRTLMMGSKSSRSVIPATAVWFASTGSRIRGMRVKPWMRRRVYGVATSTEAETTAPAIADAKKQPSTSCSKLWPSSSVRVMTDESG